MTIPRVSQPDAWLRAGAKHLLVSEMATAKNARAETAEGMVIRSLAKAKLQFPVVTEEFE